MADFDPYRIWLGIPPKEQPPDHYRLLGVGLFESDPDVISNAADRQMVHVRTFQSGKHSQLSQRLLNELAAARVCLLDPQKKGDYDSRLRKELAAHKPGPPPPRATVPAPPAANSGLRVSASHRWDMENAPPNGRALPPVQTAADTFSGTTRPTRLATRRKQSVWYGAATTIVLVGLGLVLVVWALNRSESEPPDKLDPAVKRNGNGTSNSRPPKRPRKQPNHRLRPTNPSAHGAPDQGTANVLPSSPGSGSNVAGTVGEIRAFQGHTNRATGAVFSPDEASILSGSDDQSVRLWDVSTGAERLLEGSKKPILAVAFSPDGETVLATSGHTNPPSGGMLHLWATARGQRTHRQIDVSNAGIAWDAKFAPNGRLIALACEDASIRLLDPSSEKKEIKVLMGHNGAVRSVAFSPDGSKILSGGADYDVCLWDLANGKEIRRMIGHQGAVTSVAFSPDGNSALSGGVDKTVRLWDIATGELRQTFQGHADAVTCVVCTPDGQMALSGGLDRTIRIWRFSDGVEVHQFGQLEGSVRNIAVSADGRRAVSAGDDAVVRLWRLPDLSSGSVKTPIAGNDLPGPRPDDQGTQPKRVAVPDAPSLQKAEDLIRKAHEKEFEAAQQPSGKLALARKLLAEALKPREKSSEQPHATYALLRMAKEHATEVAAIDTALAAVDEIAARYEIEALRTKIETLQAACQVNTTSTTKRLLARKALAVLDEALAADDFDAAERLIGTARAAMSRAPDPDVRKLLEARAKETDDLKREYQAVRQAQAVLETQPDDPRANETVGRYYGLLKGDWKRGLPRLAAAADQDLKKLAQDDLAQPVILDQRRALADRWWAAAEKQSGKAQEHLRKRAAKWYQLIEPNLSGTDQQDVRRRRFQAGDPDVQIDASFLPKFTGLECRQEAVRPTMLRVFGGSAASEAAVDRALEWLAGQQDTNGSWSFAHIGSRGKAKYPNPGKLDNARNAATALALLPYLGAGNGPKEGRYKTNVNNGLTFLKGRMARIVQMGGPPTFYEPAAGQMPSHPLATIALCEASALGADPHTRKAAQAAVQVILDTQNSDGGWSSIPSPPAPATSGMYPTGWNLAALRAAQWAGLDVDQEVLQEAGQYIARMRVGPTGYRRSDNVAGGDPTATAVATSAQMVLGRPRDDRELVDYVAALGQSGPSSSGRLYLNYYNAQVMRDCGGPTREKWNTTLRDYLIGTQEMEGDLAGSWFLPDTGWSTANGGRLFCTAVATLILEVYYRSPPLYQ